ncbi:hypothetical protein [Absidia glauca]|uniref:Uncharacterized protein n=1 Tax=Absidia glauca TaxID=4829 RepID=A0A163KP39_ABSGL|nr:hypothetical protein [Absidia glauca]
MNVCAVVAGLGVLGVPGVIVDLDVPVVIVGLATSVGSVVFADSVIKSVGRPNCWFLIVFLVKALCMADKRRKLVVSYYNVDSFART